MDLIDDSTAVTSGLQVLFVNLHVQE